MVPRANGKGKIVLNVHEIHEYDSVV